MSFSCGACSCQFQRVEISWSWGYTVPGRCIRSSLSASHAMPATSASCPSLQIAADITQSSGRAARISTRTCEIKRYLDVFCTASMCAPGLRCHDDGSFQGKYASNRLHLSGRAVLEHSGLACWNGDRRWNVAFTFFANITCLAAAGRHEHGDEEFSIW